MILLLRLMMNFFMTGLLAVGGGLATLPFLYEIGQRTGWYTSSDVSNMIAVSEATPGPIGVNMATYVGYIVSGLVGAVLSTLALVLPSFIIIVIISKFLNKYKSSPLTEGTFRMLRPASSALVAAAGLSVLKLTLIPNGIDFTSLGSAIGAVDYKALILMAVVFAGTQLWKKGHPIVFILAAAVCGVLFSM